MSLDDLEKKLYQSKSGDDIRKEKASTSQPQSEEENTDVDLRWANDVKENSGAIQNIIEKTGKITKTVFWIMMILVVVAGGFLYYYLSNYLKSRDFNFEVSAPEKVMVAQPFEIKITLENKSQASFREPKIMVQLPEGIINLEKEKAAKKQVIEENLDDMNPGEMIEKKYEVIALQDPQTNKNINVVFSYLPQNINTRFEKEEEVDISLEDPIIDLNVSTPQKVFNGENFETVIKYKNNLDVEIPSFTIRFDYPDGFSPKEFSVAPTSGNNAWNINNLAPGKEDIISLKGSLGGSDNSFFGFKGQVLLPINGENVIINEKSANLSIESSPLSLNIVANGDPNYIAIPDRDISYKITYKNNTDVALSDLIIKAQLKGEMFDFLSTQTDGLYDSVSKTVTWTASNVPALKNLAPGAEGSVFVSVGVKESYPIKRMFDKNFSLKINGEINSRTVPYNVSSDKTVGLASLITKVIGDYEVNLSYVKNSGPYPPMVNKKTTYTIYIKVKNYSNDLNNFKFTGVLSPESKFIGNIKSNVDSLPQINDRTGEIIWEVPSIIATKGIIGNPVEASFQIENTPSITQLEDTLEPVSKMGVSATDAFTGQLISKTIPPLEINSAVIQ